MRISKFLALAASTISLAAASVPASAQGIPVYDSANYLQALTTVEHTLTMINQGAQQIQTASTMLSSLKQLTNVNSLATSLISSAERNILPSSAMNAATLLSGNVASLGSLGPQVQQFQSRFALTVNNPADQAYATALQNATGLAATNAALGSSTLTIAQQRTEGLEQLRTALDSAQDPKQVMDLSARIAVEQAHLQNDELKLKSIEMTEQGQAALGLAQANATRARDQNALYAANIVSGQ